jgi:hypothetical protein
MTTNSEQVDSEFITLFGAPPVEASASEEIEFVAPFDDLDTDLIIRTIDKCHFRVYKLFLKKASIMFEHMLSMPPAAEGSSDVRIVDVAEDRAIMEQLLCLCYPTSVITTKSLDEVSMLLDACDKYQMPKVAEALGRMTLGAYMSIDPFRVYILACRAGATQEAIQAAQGCLQIPLESILCSNTRNIQFISSRAYRSLVNYYAVCRQKAAKVLSSWTFYWQPIKVVYPWCSYEHDTTCRSGREIRLLGLAG